jgi:RHS repeat-associated protein
MLGWIIASLIVALGLSGLPVLSTATVPLASAAPASDITERPDPVSASVTARLLGHRVRDQSQTTETTEVFANPDGSWTSESAPGPVRALDANGAWADIDLTLEQVPGGYAPANTTDDLVVSDGGDATFAQMSVDGKDLAWKWPDGPLPAPTVEGNTATYADVVDGGDLVVTATPSGFRHDIVLHQAPADPVSFQIPIVTGGPVVAEQTDGDLTVTTKGGDELVSAPQPVMYDAPDPETGQPEHQVELDATVAKTATGAVVTLDPDESFLNDPTTTYPVTVDPTWNSTNPDDTWIYDTSPTAVHPGDATLYAGTPNGGTDRYRTLVTFNGGGAWAGQVVSSATLTLKNFYSVNADCVGAAVEVRRITTSWTPGSANWNNQPSTTTTGAITNAQAKGNSGCPAGDVSWPVTSIVQTWAAGTANYGFRVAGYDETKSATYRKYRSAGYTYASSWPRLVVTYNSYPGTPTTIGVSPFRNALVNSTTPTLSAKVSDPDLGYVYAKYAIYSGANLVWSDYGSKVTSGGTSTKAVPAGKLTNGTAYTLRTYGWDGALTSKSYASTPFTVDTTAPSVVVTSSAYSDGQWLVTPPNSNDLTLNGDADVTSFTVSQDGVALPPVTANGAGDATISWNPQSGAHVLKVSAVDRAGNSSAIPVSFSFGAGPAEFTSPDVAQRSTSSFPVTVTGPPNATGATLSWRVAGTTAWNGATSVTKVTGGAWDGSVAPSAEGTGSTSGALVWKSTAEIDPATSTNLAAPVLVEVRTCFTYPSSANVCTDPRQVQLVPAAFGANFPVAAVGPAQVALFTGEMTLTETDAADSTAGFGRTFTSFDAATTAAGIFGPGWSSAPRLATTADASATVLDNRSKDHTFIVVDATGGSQVFVEDGASTTDTTTYVPLEPTGDATRLTYAAGPPENLELTRPLGTGSVTTTWTLKESEDPGQEPAWVPADVDAPETANDLHVESDHQRPTWISESDPAASANCTPTRQAVGCRALSIAYIDLDSDPATVNDIRVASVARLIGAADQSEVTPTTIATYTYDAAGKLAKICGPVPSAQQSALCTQYTYATVDGRTVIAQVNPAGLKPWRFDYTSSGKLQTVKRESPGGSDATWTVDYDLNPTSAGLPDLSADTGKDWGQTNVPSKVFAVTAPTTGAADITNATLYYTGDDGATTNTATYGPHGWLVDTNWYDAKGNVIQTLDGEAWSRVQSAPETDRPQMALDASSYTVYNTWGGANVAGTRVVDQYGPAHTAVLEDGTGGSFRNHMAYMYDDDPAVPATLIEGRPDGDGLGLEVRKTASASDVDRSHDYDLHTITNRYDPVVDGDGSGWKFGTPTTVITAVDSNTSITEVHRLDASGRQIETRQPGGSSDTSGAGADAHSTVTTYYTAGPGECGSEPAWAGLVCKVSPAKQPSGPTMPVTHIVDYDDDLQPTRVEELSGPDPEHMVVTRITTTSYDSLGRVTGKTLSTVGSGVDAETIATNYTYADQNGLPSEVTSADKTVTVGYDSWGRANAYTDAVGTNSATTYDAAGQVATFNDGTATYDYGYDGHGFLTSVNAGGGVGTFAYSYTAGGLLDTVTYPNGVIATRTYDEVGGQTGLVYSQGQTELLGFSATLLTDGRTTAEASPASARHYTFDGIGRLTKVQENTFAGGCATRIYGFDGSSNRTTSASYAPDVNGDCQTGTPAYTTTGDYDAAGRIRDPGYAYDTLGRTLTTPQTDAGPRAAGDLSATFHADDMVATLSQHVENGAGGTDAVATSYGLDPTERVNAITTATNGIETQRLRYRFADPGDAPTSIDTSTNGGNTWVSTRYVTVPILGMAASTTSGVTTLRLANLHGDLVASMADTSGATLDDYAENDEFGNATANTPVGRYQWLGAHQRSNDAPGGLILMGARLYNPETGMFATPDPVAGGNLTAYGYPADPVNDFDLTGEFSIGGIIHKVTAKIAAAAKSAIFWALQQGLTWGLSALVCTSAAAVCRAMIAGATAFTVSLLKNVFVYGHHVSTSLVTALDSGFAAFVSSLVVFKRTPGFKEALRSVTSGLKSFAGWASSYLRSHGHAYTAAGIINGSNYLVNRILLAYG